MSFRNTIKQQLSERMRRNPKYSLRAFARDMGMTSARMSEILSGKKGLSREAAVDLAKRLGLTHEEATRFCDEVEAEHGRAKLSRLLAMERIKKNHRSNLATAKRLDLDAFKTVSDWEHLAILELMRMRDYQDNVKWISERLNLKPLVVETALIRLENLGLCEKKNGRRFPTEKELHSPDGVPSDAIKRYHASMCDRAKDALYFQGLDDRDFFSFVMALDPNDLPEIRARARQFFAEIDRDFGGKSSSKKVYQLGSQVFSLSH